RGFNAMNGIGTQFTNAITGFVSGDYMLITDGTSGNLDILTVDQVVNDTFLTTVESASFILAGVHYKKPAIGSMYHVNYPNNSIIIANSVSNTSCQFSNTSIRTLLLVGGGSGYTNVDSVVVTGGTLNATANIITNASGSVVGLNISNAGFGFTT